MRVKYSGINVCIMQNLPRILKAFGFVCFRKILCLPDEIWSVADSLFVVRGLWLHTFRTAYWGGAASIEILSLKLSELNNYSSSSHPLSPLHLIPFLLTTFPAAMFQMDQPWHKKTSASCQTRQHLSACQRTRREEETAKTPREWVLHPHLLHEERPAYPRVPFAGVLVASVTFYSRSDWRNPGATAVAEQQVQRQCAQTQILETNPAHSSH